MTWRPSRSALTYASCTFGASLIISVFNFYYVKVFLNLYNIQESWFQAAQVIYMIWNAINDPLFGYCQDNSKLPIFTNRRHAILYGAPIFAISFLVPWFPWADYTQLNHKWIVGLHLIVTLCFYDALFSFVLIAQCCLLSEMSTAHADRLQKTQYAQVASIIGSSSVFFCDSLSNNLEDITAFQRVCTFLALISCMAMMYTGTHAQTQYEKKIQSLDLKTSTSKTDRTNSESIFTLTKQMLCEPNFLSFVTVNLLSEFHRAFLFNFSSIFIENLVPTTVMSSFVRSIVFGLFTFLPQVAIILATPLLSQFGYYVIFKWALICKITSGLLMFLIGPSYPVIFVVFTAGDWLLAGSLASFMGMPLTDIVDDDQSIYKRDHPLSAMIFGTNALVTKPGISLAPMIVVKLLNSRGYESLKMNTLDNKDPLLTTMFSLSCFIPLVVGSLQLFIWKFYKIRNSHITTVKYIEA